MHGPSSFLLGAIGKFVLFSQPMCGIVGIFGQSDAATWAVEGLFAQQHRGQDACGIASADGNGIRRFRTIGLVREALGQEVLQSLSGMHAIGHVRYPTQGEPTRENAQPHVFHHKERPRFALASNGDITNLPALESMLRDRGYRLEGTNDGEVIAKAIGTWAFDDGLGIEEAIRRWMKEGRGAYSTVLLTPDTLYVFRDPHGIRPLCLGRADGARFVASETVALDIVRATYERHVSPGEILRFDGDGEQGLEGYPSPGHHHCIFEHIYFARPDSIMFGERVFEVRERIGRALAGEDDVPGDVVIPIPDSANFIGHAYAHARGIPVAFGLVRNHYVGRTFITPGQAVRDESVRLKFNPLPGFIEGKRVFLVDDSIVRGTTIRKLVRMMKENGAREVHLRIGSPPITHSCFYGIDTPQRRKLVAAEREVEEVCRLLEADTLRYLSLEGLRSSVTHPEQYCYACFTGDYPAGRKDVEE